MKYIFSLNIPLVVSQLENMCMGQINTTNGSFCNSLVEIIFVLCCCCWIEYISLAGFIKYIFLSNGVSATSRTSRSTSYPITTTKDLKIALVILHVTMELSAFPPAVLESIPLTFHLMTSSPISFLVFFSFARYTPAEQWPEYWENPHLSSEHLGPLLHFCSARVIKFTSHNKMGQCCQKTIKPTADLLSQCVWCLWQLI